MMTEKTLVALMGEQPIPLLLSIREQKPDRVIIVHTARTEGRAGKLQELIAGEVNEVILIESAAYDLRKVMEDIQAALPKEGEVIFDVTGGTKVMSLAATLIAQQHGAKMTYIITADSQGRLLTLGNPIEEHPLSSAAFTLDEYFTLYLGNEYHWASSSQYQNSFERAVCDALKERFNHPGEEIWCNVKLSKDDQTVLEIDIVVRYGIQVGVAEIKANRKALAAIHQATTYGNPKLLGTYIKRFAIVRGGSSPIASDPNIKVEVIQVSFDGEQESLNDSDAEYLVETIRKALASK